MEKIQTLKLIATYARVSTSNQEDNETIQTQIMKMKEFAQENKYTIVKEYLDEGWSGDTLARPSLDQLRQDVRDKKWEAVLIYDPDRLARRYSYQELVMDELREAGIEIIFVTVKAPVDSGDKILHGVRGLFAEYERAKITERFRIGKVRKAKDGHLLVSESLYGYTYVPKQDKVHGFYQINESETEVVRSIFNWIAYDNLTLRGVVKKLQELNIKPRKSKRGVWSTSTLSTLLRNKAYTGEARWGSSYSVVPENPTNLSKYKKLKKSSRKRKPEEEWVTSTIPVPQIITKELFEKVQNNISTHKSFSKRNMKNEYLLTGKICCSCGRKRTGEGTYQAKNLYYRCTDRVCNYPLPAICKEKGLNARIVDQLIWDKVSGLMCSPKLLEKQIKNWIKSKESNDQNPVIDSSFIKKEILKLEEQEGRYTHAYGIGIFTLEQLEGYLKPIREKKDLLKSQLTQTQQKKIQETTLLPTPKDIQTFVKEAQKQLIGLNFEAKRGIILNTIDQVIGTKRELQVTGHIPITSNINVFTINRNRRSPKRR